MNANIFYKIDNLQQFIQFEQINDLYQINLLFAPFLINFNLSPYQGEIQNPTIKVSTLPLKDEHIWYKYTFSSLEDIVMYLKYEDKLYFYFYIQKFKAEYHQKLKTLIFHSLITSCILRKNNLLLIQGILLNNGDIIVYKDKIEKENLCKRINQNNLFIRSVSDEEIILDLNNKIAYPIPRLYETFIVDFNTPIKLNRIMILKQYQIEEIKQINQNDWKQTLFENSLFQIFKPFIIKELEQNIKEKIKETIVNINDVNYLSISTNTDDINQYFTVIQDNAEDVILC